MARKMFIDVDQETGLPIGTLTTPSCIHKLADMEVKGFKFLLTKEVSCAQRSIFRDRSISHLIMAKPWMQSALIAIILALGVHIVWYCQEG